MSIICRALTADKTPSGWYSGDRSTGVHDVNCCSSRQPNSWTEAGLPAREPPLGVEHHDGVAGRVVQRPVPHFAGPHRLFRPPLLGDVAGDAERADNLAVGGVQRHFRRQGPRDVTVGPRFLLFLVDHRPARANDLLLVGQGLGRVLAAEEVRVRFAHGLGRIRDAEQPRQCPVDADEATGFVLEVNAVREIVHQGMQQVAFLLQFVVRIGQFRRADADADLQVVAGGANSSCSSRRRISRHMPCPSNVNCRTSESSYGGSLLPTPITATIRSPSKIGTFMCRWTWTWPSG